MVLKLIGPAPAIWGSQAEWKREKNSQHLLEHMTGKSNAEVSTEIQVTSDAATQEVSFELS